MRAEHGLFIAEGAKIVPELIQSSITIRQLVATPQWIEKNRLLTDQCEEVFTVNENVLERLSSLSTPNEVIATAVIPHYTLHPSALTDQLSLVLDTIQDPGNMGTIIRLADWFGITNIICSATTVDAYNAKVIQATMGSIARVKVHYTDLAAFLRSIPPTLPIYGALLKGTSIYDTRLDKKGILIMGNESSGISESLLPFIQHQISIPNFSAVSGSTAIDSLNVAVATAIICAEFRRR